MATGPLLQYIILLLSCVLLCSRTTKKITYMHQGIRCVKCSPGTSFVDHCDQEDEDARCRLCPDGTYSSQYNTALSCDPCKRTCEHVDLVPVTNCTHQTNMACACPKGKFNVNAYLDLFHAKCMDYGACGPGYGVKNIATSEHNTTCERCLVGKTYSSSTSASDRCQSCTNCGHFDVISKCNGTHDRICKEEPYDVMYPPQSSDRFPMKYIIGVAIAAIIVVFAAAAAVIYLCKERLPCFREQYQSPTQNVSTVYEAPEEYEMKNDTYRLGGSSAPSSPVSTVFHNISHPPTPTDQQPTHQFAYHNPVEDLTRSGDVWSDSVGKIMMTLSEELINAQSWQSFIRVLYEESGLRGEQADRKITVAKANYPHNLPEQIYQCCIKWSLRPEASANVLIKVLQNEDRKVILKVLRERFPDVFRIESTV